MSILVALPILLILYIIWDNIRELKDKLDAQDMDLKYIKDQLDETE